MSVQTRVTFAELEQMPDDAIHRELLAGELIELPPPKRRHSEAASALFFALADYCRKLRWGKVYAEAGFRLVPGGDHWLEPDVSLVRADRLGGSPDEYFEGSPDLAVEVISPSETATDVEAKTQAYLNYGAFAVWNVFPKLKRVHVHRHDGTQNTFGTGTTLSEPDLLPGFALAMDSLFYIDNPNS